MRIESGGDNRVGAIMVKFNSYEKKREVFRGISLLKKTGYSLKEDNSIQGQSYNHATAKFGFRNVWTLEGNVFCADRNGARRKLISLDDLNKLILL